MNLGTKPAHPPHLLLLPYLGNMGFASFGLMNKIGTSPPIVSYCRDYTVCTGRLPSRYVGIYDLSLSLPMYFLNLQLQIIPIKLSDLENKYAHCFVVFSTVLEYLCLCNGIGPRMRFHQTWSLILCISSLIETDMRVVNVDQNSRDFVNIMLKYKHFKQQ